MLATFTKFFIRNLVSIIFLGNLEELISFCLKNPVKLVMTFLTEKILSLNTPLYL